MFKKIIMVFLCVAMSVGALGGCGESDKEKTVSADKTKISISFWEPGTENELEKAYTELVKGYNEVNPNVDIEIMAQPYSGYQEWIKTQMAAGTMPTIIYNEGTQISDLYHAGQIEELDEAMNSENKYADNQIWSETFVDEKLQSSKDKEHFMALPISALGLAYYYNKDIYKEYSLEIPKTWDQFMANCKIIEEKSKKSVDAIAFMAQKEDAVNWMQWLVCTGLFGDAFLEDEKVNANMDNQITEKELIKAIDTGYLDLSQPGKWQDFYLKFLEIMRSYSKYANNASGLDEAGAKTKFLSGKAAHLYSGSWDVQALLGNEGSFEIGAFKFPYFTKNNGEYAGVGMTIPQVSLLSVTKQSDDKKRDAAIDFLEYITAPKNYKKYVEITRCIPSVKNVDVDDSYNAFIGGERRPIIYFGLKSSKSEYSSYDAVISALIGQELPQDEMLKKVQQANLDFAKEGMEKREMSKENNYLDLEKEEKFGGDYKSSTDILRDNNIVLPN